MVILFTNGEVVSTRKPVTYEKVGIKGSRRWHVVYSQGRKVYKVPVRNVVHMRSGNKVKEPLMKQ